MDEHVCPGRAARPSARIPLLHAAGGAGAVGHPVSEARLRRPEAADSALLQPLDRRSSPRLQSRIRCPAPRPRAVRRGARFLKVEIRGFLRTACEDSRESSHAARAIPPRRRFGVTPEPRGKSAAPRRRRAKKLVYVIQKHRATALHYDFRLEWNGVMLSWAVPKGPSLDPADKRLAMPTEDHPIEYNKFEGVIPEGEYGGGTVMIWDRGTWTPECPGRRRGAKKGELKFRLDGEKLQGIVGARAHGGRPGEKARSLAPHQAPRRVRGNATRRRGAALGRLGPAARRDRARRGRQHGEGRRRRSARAPAQDARRSELVKPREEAGKRSVWHSSRSVS